MNKNVRYMVVAAICCALGVVFPTFFHMFGGIGTALLPMHIPVLICGFLCGPFFGLLCGLLTPFLSSVISGMPPLFPIGLGMMMELAAYGFFTGLLYKKLKLNIYVSLLSAMIIGRIVNGIANLVLLGMAGKAYTMTIFISGAFINAIPGIILQIVVIPILIIALQKSGLWDKQNG